MHKCWRDNKKIKKLCDNLLKRTIGLMGYYHASELLQTMCDIHKSMMERHCFYPCFSNFFLYVSIQNNRDDFLTLLLSDNIYEFNYSTTPCYYIYYNVSTVFGKVQQLLCEESPLDSETANRLHDIVCQDIQSAVEFSIINNELDSFKVLLSYDMDLNKKR